MDFALGWGVYHTNSQGDPPRNGSSDDGKEQSGDADEQDLCHDAILLAMIVLPSSVQHLYPLYSDAWCIYAVSRIFVMKRRSEIVTACVYLKAYRQNGIVLGIRAYGIRR